MFVECFDGWFEFFCVNYFVVVFDNCKIGSVYVGKVGVVGGGELKGFYEMLVVVVGNGEI